MSGMRTYCWAHLTWKFVVHYLWSHWMQ